MDGDRSDGETAAAKEPHSGRQEGSMGSHPDNAPLLLQAPSLGDELLWPQDTQAALGGSPPGSCGWWRL